MHRFFYRLTGRGCEGLCETDGVSFFCRIKTEARFNLWCARLIIPERKLREVLAGDIGKNFDEVFNGCSIAIMALKIEIHTFAEQFGADDRSDHTHHFRTFFINGRRIEVVDLAIFTRAYRMRKGAAILRELLGFQYFHFCDALYRTRAFVGRKFMVAINRQAFLEAQLEPVAAGDAIAGPVMEIFVRDHGFDASIIDIRCRFGVGQHIFVVKDIEALVFHSPHVEVRDGNDVEDIEVIFAAELFFVPTHGTFQRIHRIKCAILFAMFNIDGEVDRTP